LTPKILSDDVWETADGTHGGVFVFARAGQLAGLEVWSAGGMGPIRSLPAVDQLRAPNAS
jgi:hypothetical protein